MFVGALLMLPSFPNAHTQLSASSPQQGQVITEDFNEVSLTFEGTIEKLSTMGLLKDDKEIPLNQIQIQGAKMVGTLKAPLENGTYRLQWKIAGHDGHPVTGEIQFQVNKNQGNQEPNTPTVNNSDNKENLPTITAQQNNKEKAEIITKEEPKKSSSKVIITIFIGLLLILVMGFFLLLRRK